MSQIDHVDPDDTIQPLPEDGDSPFSPDKPQAEDMGPSHDSQNADGTEEYQGDPPVDGLHRGGDIAGYDPNRDNRRGPQTNEDTTP